VVLRPRILLAATLALAALAAAAPGGAVAQPGGAQAAKARAQLPGSFDVRGAPLAKRRRAVAGGAISVYLRPRAVTLDGCRTRSSRVRLRRGRAAIAVAARCERIPGPLRVRGVVAGKLLRGVATRGKRSRRFRARLDPPPGRLLKGRGSRRATRSVRDTDRLQRHAGSEVSSARGGRLVPRTEISLRFKPGATVGQVNAALRSVGGRIAGALDGSTHLVVAIPDPGSLEALDAVLSGLERRKGVRRADRTELAGAQELPPAAGSPPSGARAAELSHLLAMRMPAAWNARAAVKAANRPTVIVADIFGNGTLSSQVDATFAQSDLLSGLVPIIPQSSRAHGYHVTGVLTANFAGNSTPAGRVTGVFPSTTRLKIVDVAGETLDAAAVRVLQAVQAQPGRVVVNTSLGHNPGTSDSYARQEGSDWNHEIRTRGYLNRMLHAGAAGNDGAEASRNSPWVSATLRTDLVDPLEGFPLGRLTNTLAVENLVDSGAPEFTPGCLSFTSNHGGTIAAVGHRVFSNLFGSNAGNRNGTSMAAPQLAALAEYLWSIAPDLTAPQLRSLVVATAAPPLPDSANCGTDAPSAPRLDAYRAVLSLDQGVTVTPTSAPVRMAILDRTGDGAFTQADLAAHAGARRLSGEGARDWSRSDLNGDGFTGGPGTAPFDLDPNGSPRGGAPQLGTATTADGSDLSFDESGLTDVQILCFYARSALYTGSPQQRDSLLGPALGCGAPPEPPESENCTATTAFGRTATIMGTSGDDEIIGTTGDDVILGGGGDDRIAGRQGNDRICSGPGNDDVRGGSQFADSDDEDGFGPDPPIDSGDDLLDGGPGTDRVTGTGGDDRVFGGDGDNDSVLGGSPGSDFMDGGPGDDDVCSRAEIPRDGGAGGPDSFGTGCEFINNF
jgi:Subtilase family/RTX calcium-binding nonapeptide repeat (4 copies)